MKKNYFFTLLLVFLTLSGFSQIEIKGLLGTNFTSSTDLPEGLNQSTLAGFQAGAGVLIGKTWYVEPGIQWVSTGIETSIDGFDGKTKSTFSSVRIPVMFGYRFFGGSENLLNLRLFLGPSLNLLTDIKVEDESFDKELYNSAIWGATAGAGVDVLFLFLDLGYEVGLSEIFKDSDNSVKNNTFYISIGGRFRIGG